MRRTVTASRRRITCPTACGGRRLLFYQHVRYVLGPPGFGSLDFGPYNGVQGPGMAVSFLFVSSLCFIIVFVIELEPPRDFNVAQKHLFNGKNDWPFPPNN